MVRHAQPHHDIYCGMVDWVISFDPFSRLYYKWSRTGHTVLSACINASTARSLYDNTEHTPLSGLAVAGRTRSSTSHCAQEPNQEQPPLEPVRRHPSLGRTPAKLAPTPRQEPRHSHPERLQTNMLEASARYHARLLARRISGQPLSSVQMNFLTLWSPTVLPQNLPTADAFMVDDGCDDDATEGDIPDDHGSDHDSLASTVLDHSTIDAHDSMEYIRNYSIT